MADEKKDDDGVAAITTIIGALKPLDNTTRLNVLDFVTKQLGIQFGAVPSFDFGPPLHEDKAFRAEGAAEIPTQDLRSLAENKNPQTVNDKVAVLAYYLKNLARPEDRRDFVSTEDISRYFPEAGFPLPTQPRMALTNAKNAGYFVALGDGRYRLNPVGHNLVAHKLPTESGSVEPRRRRRASKRKSAKKSRR